MLAFSIDYYGIFFRATQSVELFCTYRVTLSRPEKGRLILKIKVRMITYLLKIKVRMITYLPKNAGIRSLFETCVSCFYISLCKHYFFFSVFSSTTAESGFSTSVMAVLRIGIRQFLLFPNSTMTSSSVMSMTIP